MTHHDNSEYTLKNGAIVHDKRTDEQKAATQLLVLCLDSFMSGWGKASGGRSYFAVACPDAETAGEVEWRMKQRNEFKKVRVVDKNYRAPIRNGDHLSITHHTDFNYQPRD
jgi:hypothetical protein